MIHTPFKEATKGMTFREKLDHFWTYYKLALGVAAGLIMILCMIITGIVNSLTKVVYSGIAINTFMSAIQYRRTCLKQSSALLRLTQIGILIR